MTSYCLLSARLNNVIHRLASFTIIKITDYFMALIGSKKILVLEAVEVMTSGQLVGVKLGNPAMMGSDGKIPRSLPSPRGKVELKWESEQRTESV